VKIYIQNLPTKTWLFLAILAVVVVYPVFRILAPALLHAVMPEAVRNMLSAI
jgi:hypothetical protein